MTNNRESVKYCTFMSFSLIVIVLVTVAVFAYPAAAANAATDTERIQEIWAPVINQAVATTADFITTMDFDGDWIGSNNWENFNYYPHPAFVYYDVKETDTHWFLFYALYHPRDYTPDINCPSGCHENDLEALQLVVRKDGSPRGDLELMETLFHSEIALYTNKKYIKGGALKVRGGITMKKGRPEVFVEQYGHGIYGNMNDSISANPHVTNTIRYVYKGEAEEPTGVSDRLVGYDLAPIHETFWAHRDCVGQEMCFDGPFDYRGATLPAQIDGNTWGRDSANTPWGYGQATGGDVVRGDWFFDPAKAILYHAGPIADFDTEYVSNVYLDEIAAMRAAEQ